MAEEDNTETIRPEFPISRVKKIMKLDKDINKITSEAMFVVATSTELFLRLLAENSAKVTIEKKRKTINLEHMRIAVKRHQPTSDFLLDSLPVPTQLLDHPATERNRSNPAPEKPLPVGTRRIDDFFRKPPSEDPVEMNDS
ncbi:hypothetical protein QYF36_013131 [Acer negundo]|nr:hypothetical protein QYF36_021571 [Acer negundo]KAK4841950.1 hypothetical protein QYF36_013131 [Acer negundo]